MSAPGPVLARLRVATAPAHQALDDGLDVVRRLALMAERRRLLGGYYRMHESVEGALAPWLGAVDGLDLPSRLRTPALLADLKALHVPVPPAAPGPVVASPTEALGLLYVLEGSTLGGRMIHKALAAQGCGLEGLSFLDPYGAATGERWRGFLHILERDGASDPAGVERGAVSGFEHAAACLLHLEPAA